MEVNFTLQVMPSVSILPSCFNNCDLFRLLLIYYFFLIYKSSASSLNHLENSGAGRVRAESQLHCRDKYAV